MDVEHNVHLLRTLVVNKYFKEINFSKRDMSQPGNRFVMQLLIVSRCDDT